MLADLTAASGVIHELYHIDPGHSAIRCVYPESGIPCTPFCAIRSRRQRPARGRCRDDLPAVPVVSPAFHRALVVQPVSDAELADAKVDPPHARRLPTHYTEVDLQIRRFSKDASRALPR